MRRQAVSDRPYEHHVIDENVPAFPRFFFTPIALLFIRPSDVTNAIIFKSWNIAKSPFFSFSPSTFSYLPSFFLFYTISVVSIEQN
jgi:hypothetical protein